MHDFYYSRLLGDPTKFKPRTGNMFVEIVDPNDGTEVAWSDGEIEEADIDHWLGNASQPENPSNLATQHAHKAGHKQYWLRLLIGSPEEHHSDAEILPLPISRDTFETIRQAWNFPTELLRMMLSTLPIATEFTTLDPSGVPITGLMIRGGRSRDWNFCLALTHNPDTGTTHALLNGMQTDEIERLLTCMRNSRHHVRDPSLLPIFLLELKVHCFAILLEKRAVGIEAIEYDTGMRHGFSTDPRQNTALDKERAKRLKGIDFGPITQKLTGVTGTLAFCEMTFKSSVRALEVVMGLRARRDVSSPEEPTDQPANRRDIETKGALDRRIAYLKELIAGAQAHGMVLTERTRAQVQTVYSMIGQRDNRLNIETAAASREIAATSLLHNAAMKDIAEDSRKVAILTRRDSTDMRIIAAVTLVFLPGTFIATLFGSGFFNFRSDGGGQSTTQIVSGWIWLYWVLTVGITVVVLVAWYYFSKRQNRAMWRVFDLEGQQQQKKTDATGKEGAPKVSQEEVATNPDIEWRRMSQIAAPELSAQRTRSRGRDDDLDRVPSFSGSRRGSLWQ